MLNWLLVGSAQLAVVLVCGEGWFCSTAGCAEGAYDGLSGGGLHASAVRGRMVLACQPDGSWFEGRGGGGLCLLRARPCLVCWHVELTQQLGPFGACLHAVECIVTTFDAGYYIRCRSLHVVVGTLTSRMRAVADTRRLMERTPSAPPRCPGRLPHPRQAAGRGLGCPVSSGCMLCGVGPCAPACLSTRTGWTRLGCGTTRLATVHPVLQPPTLPNSLVRHRHICRPHIPLYFPPAGLSRVLQAARPAGAAARLLGLRQLRQGGLRLS